MYNFQFIFYFSLAFFLLQKKYCIFSIFYCCSPSHALDFVCFCFIFFLTESSGPVTVGCEPAKTWPLHGGPKAETFAPKNRSMGFCWFACVFLYGCVIFVLLWVYVVFLYISIHICNIFVICNIYTWFLFFAHSLLFIACLLLLLLCISLKSYVCSQFVNVVCLAVTCLLCYNICCCLIK